MHTGRFLDDLGLRRFDKRHDLHNPTAFRAGQGIDLIDSLDEHGQVWLHLLAGALDDSLGPGASACCAVSDAWGIMVKSLLVTISQSLETRH